MYQGKFPEEPEDAVTEEHLLRAWREAFSALDGYVDDETNDTGGDVPAAQAEQAMPRRSERLRQQNPRYYNENLVNE